MEKKRSNGAVKEVLLVLSHAAVAGVVLGLLLLFSYMMTADLDDAGRALQFEDSSYFLDAYEARWYDAARLVGLQEMFGTQGDLTKDQEVSVSVNIRGEQVVLNYRLEDVNRWCMVGFSDDGEVDAAVVDTAGEADGNEIHRLKELYYPTNVESVRALEQLYDLNGEEITRLHEAVAESLSYLGDCVTEYHKLRQSLEADHTNFRYFAEKNGTVYTNMPELHAENAGGAVQKLGAYFVWNEATSESEYNISGSSRMSMETEVMSKNWISYAQSFASARDDGGSWLVITGADTSYPVSDLFTEQKEEFEKVRPLFTSGITTLILSSVIYFISLVALTVLAGKKPGQDQVALCALDRWKTEIELLFFFALASALLFVDFIAMQLVAESFDRSLSNLWLCAVIAMGAAVLSNAGLIAGWMSLVRRIKAGNLISNSLMAGLCRGLKGCWSARTVTLKTGLSYLAFLLANLYLLGQSSVFAFFLAMLIDLLVGVFLLRQAVQMQQIREGMQRITDGELDYKIDTEGLTGNNRMFAGAVNSIGDGLANAVEKSLKSERLKTDLITNVSHDIKTPLTSIINYVDLMKRENIQDEKLKGYLNVLEAKSWRLKNLTEDLVEASKISSGNIQLEFMNVDLVELVNQTNGEFSEKFSARQLQLITTLPKEPVYVQADGRRMWRVVENLYNNAAKYAMPGSRVYADLSEDHGRAVFSLKNISEQPLNIRADELTERFVRGDVSRSTEGSGLGLSIARNLTELQKGTFEIYLDGDLFRVTITFPQVKPAAGSETEEEEKVVDNHIME